MDTVCTPNRTVIALGDFNLPEIVWRGPHAHPTLTRRSARALSFMDTVNRHGLIQHVDRPTRENNCLDLVLANVSSVHCEVEDGYFDSDHRQVSAAISVPCLIAPRVTRSTAYNYRRADFSALRDSLRLLPWHILDTMSLDDAVDQFYTWVNAAIADHVPTVALKSKFPPWFDGQVKSALRDKDVAHRRMRQSSRSEDREAFRRLRTRFKQVAEAKYRRYLLHIVDDFKVNSKRFWSLLKSVKRSSTISTLKDGDRVISDDYERAQCFSRAFVAKFSNPTVTVFPDTVSYDLDKLPQFTVTQDQVLRTLLSIDVHKACGPDGLSGRILSECAHEISVPLTIICQLSLSSGRFPRIWRRSHVIPVHKKGSRQDATNYRPVSLLSICSKVLERVVCDQLLLHVAPALSTDQHGFLAGRSCETNLSCLLNQLWESVAGGHQTDVIYTDYSSAFTSVNHELMLHKLQNSYHLSDAALGWFRSYLCDREQCVVLNGKKSDWTPVRSGVPEGSICGPILFVLFCNDVAQHISSTCLMYADDMKLSRWIRSPDDAALLQLDLDRFCEWSSAWKLQLNPTKCKAITFTLRKKPIVSTYSINQTALERVSEIRDLGVILDSKLTFGPHIDSVVGRANRALGMYLRSLSSHRELRGKKFPPAPLIVGFNAHIRSIVEFGSVIWAGTAKTHLKRIERIQHKFLIWLAVHSSKPCSSLNYDVLQLHFNVLSIDRRLALNDFNFIHNVFSGRINSPNILSMFSLAVPSGRTRSRPVLREPTARVETIKNGMFCRLPRLVNGLCAKQPSADLFGIKSAFKREARAFVC